MEVVNQKNLRFRAKLPGIEDKSVCFDKKQSNFRVIQTSSLKGKAIFEAHFHALPVALYSWL